MTRLQYCVISTVVDLGNPTHIDFKYRHLIVPRNKNHNLFQFGWHEKCTGTKTISKATRLPPCMRIFQLNYRKIIKKTVSDPKIL